MTDSGRTVYGGGGITPDVKIPPIKTNKFQDKLLEKYTFFNFAKHYVINHKVDKQFEVDDAVMQEFRKFLDEQKVPFTEADLAQNMRLDEVEHQGRAVHQRIRPAGRHEGPRRDRSGSGEGAGTAAARPSSWRTTRARSFAQRNNARLTAQQDTAAAAAANNSR